MNNFIKFIFSKISFIGISISLITFLSCKKDINDYSENSKPNIVLFIGDDVGWNDVGYHGSEIRTPNIDRLVENGVELNQFYVYPTCSPSRASLLTGKYASRFGIGGPIAMKSKKVLPTNVATLPGELKKKGYQTALMGKWHLGLRPESGPNHYGFDYTYGYLHGQVDQYTHLYKNGDTTWHRNGKYIEEEGHATDLITKEAQMYITDLRDENKPMFLYIAYSVPHYPLQEEKKWIEPYKNLENVESRKIYAAATTHMDHSIGQILKSLEDQRILDNTIIIFLSDNGGQENWYPETEGVGIKLYNGRHGPYPKLGDNAPLNGYKTDLLEGGIRVPALVYWEGHLKFQKVDQMIKVTDIFPTLLSLVNSSLDKFSLDGKNIWNYISNENDKIEKRKFYFRVPNKFAIRNGDWKLIHYGNTLEEGNEELFNIKNDPNELVNTLEKYIDIRNELFNDLTYEIRLDSLANLHF